MPMLDISKLWGMTQKGSERGKPTRVRPCGKMEFRCPACALDGHDKGYDHLVVFKDNTNFGCSKFTKDSGPEFERHRNEIWKRVGIGTKATHRPEPFINPRKITKAGTLIAKHDADLAEERRRIIELRAKAKLNQPTQHIVYNTNKMSNGTFGTPFSVSHQSPSPLYNNIPNGNNDKTIPPHVPPTLKKSSQTSHFKSWRQVDGESECGSTEEYSGDFGLAFDRNNPSWREHYYLWYRHKYYGEPVVL